MRITFQKPDPRAGTTVQMDSSRGQHFINTGAAVAAKDGETAKQTNPETPPTRVDTDAAALLDQNVNTVVSAIGKGVAPEVLAAALVAENARGEKARKKVVEALQAAIKAAAPQD